MIPQPAPGRESTPGPHLAAAGHRFGRGLPARPIRRGTPFRWALVVAILLAILLSPACDLTDPGPQPDAIEIDPVSLSFDALGAQHLLSPTLLDTRGNEIVDAAFTFESGDPSVATASADGRLLARGNGSTDLSVRSHGIETTVGVVVAQSGAILAVLSGRDQVHEVGQTLEPVRLQLTDPRGNPAEGISLIGEVIAGGGWLDADTTLTDPDGRAELTWTLGPEVGSGQSLRIRVSPDRSVESGETEVTVSARALPGSPAGLELLTPDEVTGHRALPLPEPVRARVVNVFDEPVEDARVRVHIANRPVVTLRSGADGEVAAPWPLNSSLDPQTLRLELTGALDDARIEKVVTARPFSLPHQLAAVGSPASSSPPGSLQPPLEVRLIDRAELPMDGTEVVFEITSGPARFAEGQGISASPTTTGPAPTPESASTSAWAPASGTTSEWGTTSAPATISESGTTFASAFASTSASATTDALGEAASPPLQLPDEPAVTRVEARVPGTEVSVELVVAAQFPVAELAVVSGAGQSAVEGQILASPITVEVRGESGMPLEGILVRFTAERGGVEFPLVVTGEDGRATTRWRVGWGTGPERIWAEADSVVTAATVQVLPFSGGDPGVHTPRDVDPSTHRIELVFGEGVPAEIRPTLQSAADRWSRAITGDLRPVFLDLPEELCANDLPLLGTVDDLVIFVQVLEVDGVGGTAAYAGPCVIRSDGALPVAGLTVFDAADLDDLVAGGLLYDVALHEFAHVLGFGTIWSLKGLLRNPVDSADASTDTHFSGLGARQAFASAGGSGYADGSPVPVENEFGGLGTLNGHWRWNVFQTELMTGFISPETSPLSAVTLASFADLGYEVDPDEADAYTLPFAEYVARRMGEPEPPPPGIDLGDDLYRGPLLVVDPEGVVVQEIAPRGPTIPRRR